MLSLILDSSHEQTYLILAKQDTLLNVMILDAKIKQSTHLIDAIQTFLNKHQVPLSTLSFIGVGLGPGTFLGTRLGVVAAKCLSYALHLPIISFCSLSAFVNTTLAPSPFTVLSHAKSKGYYSLKGSYKDGLSFESIPSLVTLEDIKTNERYLFIPDTQAALFKTFELPIHPCPFNSTWITKHCYQKFHQNLKDSPLDLKIPYLIPLN